MNNLLYIKKEKCSNENLIETIAMLTKQTFKVDKPSNNYGN